MADKSEDSVRDAVLDAALPQVAFDGWSEILYRRAVDEAGVDKAQADILFPRKALDIAAEAHKRDDERLFEQVSSSDFNELKIRDKIKTAVRLRLELAGKYEEAVRRATALFALPIHTPEGVRLTWGTADTIWRAIGDTSDDYNWYSKRLTLSGVYSSTLLFWLGDESEGKEATWQFLDRRIADVMKFEKVKAQMRESSLAKMVLAGPKQLLKRVKAPDSAARPGSLPVGFPGRR